MLRFIKLFSVTSILFSFIIACAVSESEKQIENKDVAKEVKKNEFDFSNVIEVRNRIFIPISLQTQDSHFSEKILNTIYEYEKQNTSKKITRWHIQMYSSFCSLGIFADWEPKDTAVKIESGAEKPTLPQCKPGDKDYTVEKKKPIDQEKEDIKKGVMKEFNK